MGFLKKSTGVAFSGFEGQLLYQGEPAAGAKITRTYDLFGETGEETIVADADGKFRFETVRVKFRTPLLASEEFLSRQKMFVDYKESSRQIWGGAKTSKIEFSEFNGEPSGLVCELTEDTHVVELDGGLFIVTNCFWKNK